MNDERPRVTAREAATPECIIETFYSNGQLRIRSFWLNGKRHNRNGPAYERWDSQGRLTSRIFQVNGEFHRTDGPACQTWDKQGRLVRRMFWVNDERLSEEAFRTWQERQQQRQRELAALAFALENKFPAEAPEREFLRHILPAFVTGEAAT